jgi:hypothetical protein
LLDKRYLTDKDCKSLRFLATRLRTHFSQQTYKDLHHGVCKELGIPSKFVAWQHLQILSGLETRVYDCCVNSCVCFLGKYSNLQACPFCNEARYNSRGSAWRFFRYTPLIPQLQALFQCPKMVADLWYWLQCDRAYNGNVIQDIFDGANYWSFRETQLDPNSNYKAFSHPNDLALGLSTDGFTLFKRRRHGRSTAWPIILVNYNLPPKVRTRLENVLCVGVIPGPTQCKDLNSFLIPLVDELVQLEMGVELTTLKPEGNNVCEPEDHPKTNKAGYYFTLRAFLILVFGDIPAVSKLLFVKGHNGFRPCCACYIPGMLCQLQKNSIYYVPLRNPQDGVLQQLFMQTQELFLMHFNELDGAHTQDEHNTIAKECGINGWSVFAQLKSLDLATSFPYNIMHLLFENLVPNMIRHWIGTFKGLDEGTGSYQIPQVHWDAIGRLTAQATKTIPSSFVGTLPDIAQDRNLYKAEAYAFWIPHIAPILLKGVLPDQYYK